MDTASATPAPSLDVDLFDDASLADVAAAQAAVREHAPIVRLSYHDCWATGRDEVVRSVLADPAQWSSASGVGLVRDDPADRWQRPSAILETDPPDHDAPRRVLQRMLTPRALEQWGTSIRAVADRLVDDAVSAGVVDAMQSLAWPLPATVLPDAVGLDADGREHLLRYSSMYFNARAPGTRLAAETAAVATATGSPDWVRAQCARDRLGPDGFGAQIYAAVDAGEIDEVTAGGLVRSFLGGGIDTTALALGWMLLGLTTDADQWSRLRASPDLTRAAFDEALRWAPSASLVGREAARAIDIDGVRVGAGERVLCLMVAANRDPRRWEDADRFDLGRRTAGQLAFGLGPHHCVGHAVARLEAACLVDGLRERVSHIELVGDPQPAPNNWLYGLASLPLRLVGA